MNNILIMISAMLVASAVPAAKAQAQQTQATIFAASELKFRQGMLKAALVWVPGFPAAVGPESRLEVQWLDENNQPVDLDADFRVVLFMPHMGHGSSPTKIAKLEGAGLYRVSKIYFTMPGLWEIQVILKPTNGQASETQTLSLML